MSTWNFYAEGEPKGQPRPRAFAFRGSARVYDPGTAEGWKSAVAVAAREAGLHHKRLTGALKVDLEFYFRRPKSHFGAKGLKPSAPKHHIQKPDRDNLEKAVLDALTTVGAWVDDAQVVEGCTSKQWLNPDTWNPGCDITITQLETLTTTPTQTTP